MFTTREEYRHLARKLRKLHPHEAPIRFAARLEELQALTQVEALTERVKKITEDMQR